MTTDLFPDTPAVSRKFRLQWEEAQQGYVLLYPEGMVKLNVSAGEILKCCDGKTTVDDIVATLEAKFGTTGLRMDIEGLLKHAYQQQWIV
jgi:pyrroloquinoline quinone biosynthesis protein D